MTDQAGPADDPSRPDPGTATTPVQFVEAMQRLKAWSGLTYRQLAKRAAAAGDALPRSTLTAALTRDALPREDLLAGFVRACGCADEEVDQWTAARRRIAAAPGPEPARPDTGAGDSAGPVPAGTTTPAQLPPVVRGFVGRAEQLAALDATIGTEPTAVVITAVAGTAGVGKTALALHWAHQVAHRFPHGQLYVNLRGFDPAGTVMDPTDAIRRFLDALGVAPQRIPADPDAQVGLYRTLLAGKRMLIVLDNARDPDQVGPLLPGSPGCLVVVTSRNRLSGLVATVGAHPIPLDLLTLDEARDLLTRRLGVHRVAAEPDAVDEIITCCVRLPLALAVVAANAATQPRLSLAAIAADLRDSHDRLSVLSTGDTPATDVRAVFSWSYQTLTPAAARLFRLLGLHPGPDLTAPATASLAALPTGQIRTLLTELTRVNLIVEAVPGRYTFHDLLRAYATDLAHTTDPGEQRHAATHRILDHYLHTAYTATLLLDPARDPITLTPPQPGVTPEHPTDHEQALAWFTAEHSVMLAAVDHAVSTGLDTHTWQLAWTLDDFLDRRGHWHALAAALREAVAAAGRLADPTAQAHARRLLGGAYTELGHLGDAHTELRHALDLHRQAGDRAGQAHTHRGLARVSNRQGSPAQALDHARQALDLFRAAGHRRGQATPSTRSAGTTPSSATTSRPSPPASRPSPCSRSWATATGRPPPGTVSATPTTTSGSTPRPSPATSTPST